MLNVAMVLMILAGIFGLPAVMCSGLCSGMGKMTGADVTASEGQAIMDFLMYLAMGASLGSIIVGAMVKKMKKAISGIAALIFAACFALLLIQGNILGLVSSVILLVAAIMIFVAPADQFSDVQKVKTVN